MATVTHTHGHTHMWTIEEAKIVDELAWRVWTGFGLGLTFGLCIWAFVSVLRGGGRR